MINILALDPSILHLGWAYMCLHQHRDIVILDSGTIVVPEEYKDEELVKRIGANIEALYDLDFDVDTVVIEQPESWGAYKSMASSRSGSLLKLELLTGALVGWALTVGLEPILIPVSKWKGQLPKHVTTKRMEKKYERKFATSDEADSVGLGDWYLMQQIKVEANDSSSNTIS